MSLSIVRHQVWKRVNYIKNRQFFWLSNLKKRTLPSQKKLRLYDTQYYKKKKFIDKTKTGKLVACSHE